MAGLQQVQLCSTCDTIALSAFFFFSRLNLSMLLLSASYQTTRLLWYPPWQIALSADEPVGANENMTFLRREAHHAELGATLIDADKSPRKRILHACAETYLGLHWSLTIKTWEDKGGQWSGKQAPLGLFYSYVEEGVGGWGGGGGPRAVDWLTRPIRGAQTSGLMVGGETDWLTDWQGRRAGGGGGDRRSRWGIGCSIETNHASKQLERMAGVGKESSHEEVTQCPWTKF